jgi:hypothetical protein
VSISVKLYPYVIVMTRSPTKIPNEVYFPAVFRYAQGMVCHARAPADVPEDQNMDGHTAFRRTCGRAIVFGDAENEAEKEDRTPEDAENEGVQ